MRPYDPRLDPRSPTSEERAVVWFFVFVDLGAPGVITGAVLQALGIL